MSWNDNVYYSPEKFGVGLTIVGDMEWSEPDYSFDMTVVWKDADGVYYWARDAGCSCPAPFEDYTSLEELNRGTKWDAIQAIQADLADVSYRREYAENQAAKLIEQLVRD